MIYDIHLSVMLVLYSVIVGCLIFYYRIRKQKNMKILIWRCLFALYILLLIKVTIFPITFTHFEWMEDTSYLAVQLEPFKSIVSMVKQKNYIQITGNIILLMPLPLLLQGIKDQMFFRMKCFVSVCAASLVIEVLQFGINLLTGVRNRVFDVDDMILNISGGILLMILYKPLNYAANGVVSFIAGEGLKNKD